jgi:hypothetical protein
MKLATMALLGAAMIGMTAQAADAPKKKGSTKLTAAECQAKRTQLAEFYEADRAKLGIDEETREKRANEMQAEIAARCPTGPH